MRSLRVLALLALVVLLGSCGSSDGNGGHAGTFTLTLNTPHTDDGAILFKVNGVVDSVTGGPMVQDGSYLINPTFTRVVAAGNLVDGVVAKIWVPDVTIIGSYSITVEQAAKRTTFAQQTLTGYSISITTP
jgi:hypothetical protein